MEGGILLGPLPYIIFFEFLLEWLPDFSQLSYIALCVRQATQKSL
ncbi:hypothetical protein V6Z11_A04G131900 [Gossypium hirsutum]